MACENIEELKQYLEKKKDSFIQHLPGLSNNWRLSSKD
jgi:hypothetical protein